MKSSLRFLSLGGASAAAVLALSGQANADAGFNATAEAVFLHPYSSEEALDNSSEFGYEPGARLTFGYESESGLGVRVRYFRLDASETVNGNTTDIDRQTIDIEATQSLNFDSGSVLLSAGVRFADSYMNDDGSRASREGTGVIVGAEGVRNITADGLWQLTGDLRVSAVFGDTHYSGSSVDADDLNSSVEIRLGPQYNLQLAEHAVTIGGGVHAEYLHNGSLYDTQDAGLAGFYLNVGTRF